MPKRAITVSASQKGGTGKTFLTVQAAAKYAHANPKESVLFMDHTELGDGSQRLFGGLESMEGKDNMLGGGLDRMFDDARAAEEDKEKRQTSRLKRMFGKKVKFAVEDYAIQVNTVNKSSGLPDNLFVVCSSYVSRRKRLPLPNAKRQKSQPANTGGGAIEADEDYHEVEEADGIASRDRSRISEAIRRALTDSEKTWRVFIDTDGDRFPSSLTRLGYLLADFCVVPVQADACDFQRVEQMLSVLGKLREKGEALCQVQLVLWNKVQVYKGDASAVGHFTPPKVSIDTIQHLNAKLADFQKTPGDLFTPSFETVLVRNFPDTVAMSANACGLAFCCMEAGNVVTRGGVTYAVATDQLKVCQDGIDRILEKLEHDPLS